jgi:RHS repeat-associated protein
MVVTKNEEPGTTKTYYAIRDHQNTVWALVDGSGVVIESYDYDAWGRVLSVRDGDGTELARSAIGNRFLFQGREYSWTTGLYYFRARWYDPITGRWLSNDPIGISGGLNQYVVIPANGLSRAAGRFSIRS